MNQYEFLHLSNYRGPIINAQSQITQTFQV